MALQSLTTTNPTPSGTETVVSSPSGNTLSSNGPQPLVPAFILCGLLVMGIMMMCWWKRLSTRRGFGTGLGTGVGVGARGDERDDLAAGVGGGGVGVGGPRVNMVIGAGRGLGAGMIMLADLHAAALQGGPRRKKEVKLGPKPVLWDVHLETEEKEEKVLLPQREQRWRWRDLAPLSASYVFATTTQPRPVNDEPSNTPTSSVSVPAATTQTNRTTTSNLMSVKKPRQQGVHPSNQSTSPLRISVLISMPTPKDNRIRTRPGSRASEAETERSSSTEGSASPSGSHEAEVPLEDARLRRGKDGEEGETIPRPNQSLDDLNLVLGITDVPLYQCQ